MNKFRPIDINTPTIEERVRAKWNIARDSIKNNIFEGLELHMFNTGDVFIDAHSRSKTMRDLKGQRDAMG